LSLESGAELIARRAIVVCRAASLAIMAALAPAGGNAAAASFDSPAHLVILPALADGHPIRLLLDTGDPGGLSLDPAAASRLGLAIGPAPARAGADRGLLGPLPIPMGMVRIGRLAIDNADWGGVEALVIREDAALARAVGAPYDGVIGTALLAGRRLVIDYRLRTLSFVADAAAAPDGEFDRGSALRLDGGRLLTEVDLGRGPRPALIDTASAATLVDPRAAGSWRAVPGGTKGLVDAGGTAAGLPSVRLDSIAAGGAILRGVTALTLDLTDAAGGGLPRGMPPPAAILGADLLARHRVVLDLVAGRFALEGERP